MTHQHHITAEKDRITWTQLLAYGAGGIIPIALFNIAGQLMGLIGNIGLGLSAFWLGVIMIAPRLWDALSDPLMGHISDNTRSRFGRRRIYLLIGGIAVAVTFVIMWWVPKGEVVEAMFSSKDTFNWFQLSYILFGLLLFFTATTVFEIPHGALGMEMSADYHERTRLFSAKSFLGNIFAMGTPWLFFLASREIFKGPGGNEVDGMRYVSMLIAAVLIPVSIWWFTATREPRFNVVKKQKKTRFWENMRVALSNMTFIKLVLIVFTLAMGFNFVGLLNYYITIFYIFGGNKGAASTILGYNGTIWAVTGIIAVFPLNWISKRIGKNRTMIIAILIMCAAQLSKILCYNPEYPYLLFIPTALLSCGMLFFFTLGSSMVGDVCDEDDLKTGTRSEGSYYSVFWWFVKMGTAFASFVTGVLIVFTMFDEQQTTKIDKVSGSINVMVVQMEEWEKPDIQEIKYTPVITEKSGDILISIDKTINHFQETIDKGDKNTEHYKNKLLPTALELKEVFLDINKNADIWAKKPDLLAMTVKKAYDDSFLLARQSPRTLFLLRFVEIGLPLILCIISLLITLNYPLTEDRAYEIKELLEKRNKEKNANNPAS